MTAVRITVNEATKYCRILEVKDGKKETFPYTCLSTEYQNQNVYINVAAIAYQPIQKLPSRNKVKNTPVVCLMITCVMFFFCAKTPIAFNHIVISDKPELDTQLPRQGNIFVQLFTSFYIGFVGCLDINCLKICPHCVRKVFSPSEYLADCWEA